MSEAGNGLLLLNSFLYAGSDGVEERLRRKRVERRNWRGT
jgi:hypothetical protein